MAIGPIKHGAFHKWLGKKESEPITDADIERGLKAGGHPAKMAEFAKARRKWKNAGGKKKKTDSEHADRMYGKDSKSKRETSSKANHPPRQLRKAA